MVVSVDLLDGKTTADDADDASESVVPVRENNDKTERPGYMK